MDERISAVRDPCRREVCLAGAYSVLSAEISGVRGAGLSRDQHVYLE